MPEKLDKSQVIGLPEGAAIQFIKDKWYVFFAYCYRLGWIGSQSGPQIRSKRLTDSGFPSLA